MCPISLDRPKPSAKNQLNKEVVTVKKRKVTKKRLIFFIRYYYRTTIYEQNLFLLYIELNIS